MPDASPLFFSTFARFSSLLPRFDHFLRTRLGIATGNPFWRVSQDGIHRLVRTKSVYYMPILACAWGTPRTGGYHVTHLVHVNLDTYMVRVGEGTHTT